MKLSRDKIQRMVGSQSAMGGFGGVAGITEQRVYELLQDYVTNDDLTETLEPYATKDWVGSNYLSLSFFNALFQARKADGTTVVSPNNGDTSEIDNIKAMFGFWTDQYISALGLGNDGGGGGAGDVTWALLADSSDTRPIALSHLTTALSTYATQTWVQSQGYATQSWVQGQGYATTAAVNALEFLNNVTGGNGLVTLSTNKSNSFVVDLTHQHSWFEIQDRPTTIAGFGITDSFISNGVITIGTSTITPVTQVALTMPTGFSVSGSPVTKTGTFAITFATGYEGFTTALKQKIEALYSWFEVDSDGNIKTKDYTENSELKHRGFYSPSFISALGLGNDGGGGGAGDVTWALLADSSDTRPIALSHLTTALSTYATQTWVQSQGYATQSWVQGQGYATQSWVQNQGYATQSWVQNQGYATQTWVQGQGYATTAAVNALEFLNNVTGGNGLVTLSTNKSNSFVVDLTHQHSWFEIQDRPTTIAGFGITDSFISNGVITIGTSTITPVTQVALTMPTGFSVSGSPVTKTGTFAITFATGYEGFTTALKQKIEALYSWFEVDSDGNIKTKDYTENSELKHRGFYSPSFISALGLGNDGGGGGAGDVTWALLADSSDTRPIALSHLTTALSTYATQTWVQSQGYATQSWVQSQGYATTAAVNALEFLNNVTGGNGLVTLSTNKSNSFVVDLTHQHSFQELTDKPTTIAGYGITDVYSWARQSTKPSYAFSEITGMATANQIPSIQNINSFGIYVYSAQISRTANTVLAAPNGSAGVASFRSLVAADIPSLDWSKIGSGKPTTLSGYGITDACTQSTANGLLYTMSLNNDGTINVITLGGTTKYRIDFTHQHSFLELVDRPTTTDGYGITGGKITGNLYVLGKVGIGTSSPSYKLHVNGESYFENWMFVNSSVTALGIELQPSSSSAGHGGHIDFHYNKSSADYTTRLIEDASGRLKLIGDFYATGGVTALVATSSDIRKKNVVSYNLPLTINDIAEAPTIKFTWKDNAKLGEQVGSIAQYWQKVLPQTVKMERDESLSLQYGVAALISAITTARTVVDHERRISDLERENLELREEINRLKIA